MQTYNNICIIMAKSTIMDTKPATIATKSEMPRLLIVPTCPINMISKEYLANNTMGLFAFAIK